MHLAAQGLLARPRRRARKNDVLAAIERMRMLQIDTIHVVARSPYLVLFSRLGTYSPRWLDELLESGAIFECWAHEACFAPAADFPLHKRHALERLGHWAMKSALRMRREQAPAMEALLARIRASGAVKTADFEGGEKKKGGWWGWKDEKRWLEALFALGELMIARRENFQRVYDLGERVLAKMGQDSGARCVVGNDATSLRHRRSARARRHAGALDRRLFPQRTASEGRRSRRLCRQRRTAAHRGRWLGCAGLLHADHRDICVAAARGRLRATHTTLLSPFDPVVWDRERASALFDFDYRLECYTPAPKRVYGYYVLPILHRGRLVGRLDAKAHRADGLFEVKALFLEDGVEPSDALADSIARAIRDCAQWHATPEVRVVRCTPRSFNRPLQQALRSA